MRKFTQILLISIAGIMIGYDFIPFFNPARGDTISEVIRDLGLYCMTFPLVFGTLVGHFFLPVNSGAKQYSKILIGILFSSICLDILIHEINLEWLYTYPFIYITIGIIIGSKLWQQNRR